MNGGVPLLPRRVLAVALGLAIGLAVPLPARAATPRRAPRPVWSTPVDRGPLAVAADEHGAVVTTNLGDVLAFDRRGRTAWRAVVTTDPVAVVIEGDTVVVAGDQRVFAFGRADGRPRWSQALGSRGSAVAAAGGVAVVTDHAGSISAFDAATGAPRWHADRPAVLFHAPVIDTGARAVVAVASREGVPLLRVLDLDTGALRWERAVDRYTAVPVVHGGRVFVAEGDGHFHALVLALDLATGAPVWGSQVRASFLPGIAPAVDDRTLVVVDHYGHVTALDPGDGAYLWERSLDRTVLATRVVLNRERLVVSTAWKDVFVLDRANGRIVRHATADHLGGWAVDFTSAPFSRDETLLVVAIRLGDRERVEVWPLA